MAISYFSLPKGLSLPFPPDDAHSFIDEWFALSMKPIYEDALRRNVHQPPNTPHYRLYKNTMEIMQDPDGTEKTKKEQLRKTEKLLAKLREEVDDAKANFLNMFLAYNHMIKKNQEDSRACNAECIVGLKKFKAMVDVQRRHIKANHSLLFLKDAMEEAVETYREAESFLKTAAKNSMWESPERIQNRFSKLVAIKEEIRNREKEEITACQNIINEMYDIQQRTIEKHTILLSQARHLTRLIQDAEEGMLRFEAEERKLMKTNERAWRDYSIINMTIYDLSRGIIELRDLNPKLLEAGLRDRLDLVRREHRLNKEVLQRWGERRRAGEELLEAEVGPKHRQERIHRLRREWESKVRRLREIVGRYKGRPIPTKIRKYLAWMKRQNVNFPEADQVWTYLCELAEELPAVDGESGEEE